MTDRIVKTIELNAPLERVWRALTDHREFGAWFQVVWDGPFRVGSVSRGRITYPGCEHLTCEAEVLVMDHHRLFAFSWHPYAVDPAVDYAQEPATRVEFRLDPSGAGTRLTLIESGFDALPAHRRDEAFRMNDAGWAEQLRNIQRHVAG